MEMFELRYFLAVARIENVNRAAEEIHVSSGSLSKAISRLEIELQTPLFFKSGRGIRLTPEGMLLKKKVTQILQLEEDIRLQLAGKESGSLNIYISSQEILQTSFGVNLLRLIGKHYPQAKTIFRLSTEQKAIEQIQDGEAHLALITQEPPADLSARILAKVEFKTCATQDHPLLKKYSAKQIIPVEEILTHPFVSPDSAVLGNIAKATTVDGWRDDKFPRQLKYRVSGLKLMENLIREGLALGYLPDHFVESSGLIPLKISGCPYTCQQTVRIVAKDPAALGWLNHLWSYL